MSKSLARLSSNRMILGCALALGLSVALPACKKTVTPPVVAGLELTPVEKNRPLLVATVRLPNFEASLKKAQGMGTALGFPITPDDVRKTLFARSGLPDLVVDSLDLASPVGMAFIGRVKSSPLSAAAASAKSPEAATKFIAALGTKVEQKMDAVHVKRLDGQEVSIVARGKLLIAGDTLDALTAAGEHARAAAAGTDASDNVTATLYPEAMARAEGTDLKAAADKMKKEMAASMARNPAPPPGMPIADPRFMTAYMESFFDLFVPWVLDTDRVDLFLRVDEKEGARLGSRIHPRAGTPLARQIADTAVVAFDPGLRGGDTPAALFGWHVSESTMLTFMKLYDAMGSLDVKGAKQIAAAARSYIPLMQPVQFGRMSLGKTFEYTGSFPLKPGSDPSTVMNAIDAILKPDGLPAFMDALYNKSSFYKIGWERKGLTGTASVSLVLDKRNKEMAQAAKILTGMFGSDRFSVALAIAGGRLLFSTEPGAKTRLDALAKGTTPGSPNPEIARVLAETRGEEGFMYFDLLAFIRPAINAAAAADPGAGQAKMMMGMLPDIDKLTVPLIVTHRGGAFLDAELRVPMRTFENVGKLLAPLRGMGMGGAPSGVSPGGALQPVK